MAHLVKPWILTRINTDTGKRAKKGDPRVRTVRERAKKWYGAGIPGQGKKRFPLASDKNVAWSMLQDLVDRAERGVALMADPGEAGQPLAPLVSEFEQYVARKSGEKHTRIVLGHVRRVLAGCKLTTLAHLREIGRASCREGVQTSVVTG